MKKSISLCLLVCVTLGLFASCGQTDLLAQTTAEKTQLSAAEATGWASEEITGAAETTDEETTEEETTEEGTTAAPLVMTPAVPFDPADRLEPTSADLERLAALMDWSRFFSEDYDSDSSRILDFIAADGAVSHGMEIYDLLQEGENYAYNDAMGPDVMHLGVDPRGYSPNGGYKKIRADVMEYYLENVFHNFTYPDARESAHETGTGYNGTKYTNWDYYYEDGWYFFHWSGYGNDNAPVAKKWETKQNGHYFVTIDLVDAVTMNLDWPYQTIQVDATLVQKDGRRLWTIYSTHVIYDRFAEERNQ